MEANYYAGIDISKQRLDWQVNDAQSVRNAVVCKLIYRAFAVIKRGTPYVKIYQHEMTGIS